jgi:hypothetical protein
VSAKDDKSDANILRATDSDGRPADAGEFLEALKRAHPERWARIQGARKKLRDALEPALQPPDDQGAG